MTDISVNTSNPDSGSISRRELVNISFSVTDISASRQENNILPTYLLDSQTVVLPDTPEDSVQGYLYYTPLYREQLNYNQYLAVVDKTFQELS